MSDPFLGQISIVGFNFPPIGFAKCNGQLIPIDQNNALFALLGTTYGGDGQSTFALPDLQGRAPVHRGNIMIGESAGQETHTLTTSELPIHRHSFSGSSDPATATSPSNNVLAAKAATRGVSVYALQPATQPLAPSLGPAGGDVPHENTQPSLTVLFVIALQGIFPSRN